MKQRSKRPWPQTISLVAFDFDGVFTDNRVWVTEDGKESVVCHRGDGIGLSLLRARGIDAVVLSTETNPIVALRCKKLLIDCQHGLEDKAAALRLLAQEKQISLDSVVYVGNDINDLDCMKVAGYAVATADAHPMVLGKADLVLQTRGGCGAVREICELIIENLIQRQQ
jgi:3-deoxy-D-manno-octulosonate 8-phosphate phosphatase (KDO 8-P phosphatase)